MTTKSSFLNDNQRYFVNGSSQTDNIIQYSNLKLNQNHKSLISNSVQSYNKFNKDKFSASLKVRDSTVSDNFEEKEKSQAWNKSSDLYLNILKINVKSNKEKVEKRWKKESSDINNSTLSLNFTAHENSTDAVSNHFNDKNVEDLGKEKHGTTKPTVCASTLLIQNPFEFSRQQKYTVPKPEVSHFKTSQRLITPTKVSGREESESLLRRRQQHSESGEPSTDDETKDINNIRRPLKLELGDSDLRGGFRKRKLSNIIYEDDLKVKIDDEEEKDVKTKEKDRNDLLKLQPTGWKQTLETLGMELTRGFSADNNQDKYQEKKNKVNAFLIAPFELEKFLYFGFFHCLDAFCYIFTILPLRCVLNIIAFVLRIRPWRSAQTCDFIKVFIIIFASLAMSYTFDTSRFYHLIRGQGLVKLYIAYNMLEVADKLFSSFGQDVLDSCMYLTSQRLKDWSKYDYLYFPGAIIYAYLHAFLLLLQGTTLNVAFNSQGSSLMTILISNNFVELKGSVFKKFAKPNLFQMACSDVRERFHLIILVVFVILRNMTANHWRFDYLYDLLPDLIAIGFSEIVIDAFKHAFITKFNDISYIVYQDFSTTLAFDVAKSREKTASGDFADVVSRRMGFIPIPIAVMLIHTISQSVDLTSSLPAIIIGITWVILLIVKIFNGSYLYTQAVDHIQKYRTLQKEAEFDLYRKRMLAIKSKSAPNSPRLSLIDFTDVFTQKATAGFTISDYIPHKEELVKLRNRAPSTSINEQSPTPRRSVSMMNFSWEEKRDRASLPPSIPENDEKLDDTESQFSTTINREKQQQQLTQQSPKRKPNVPMTPRECAELDEVSAFKLLNSSEPVQEIQS